MRMRRFRLSRWFSLALAAVFTVATGCGDDDNPASSSGTASVPDHDGPNTAITTSNAQAATITSLTAVYGALGRAMSSAAQKPAAAAKSVSNVVIQGQQSGTLTIQNGEYTAGSDGSQTLSAELVFDDFSDDGQLYIGGPVDMDLTLNMPSNLDLNNPGAGIEFSFTLKGDLAFSGTYKGTMSVDYSVDMAGGVPTVQGTVTVDGNTVTL